jgi:hypothetical protein
MQPYLFPYFGYVQLIQAADIFVIYDDAQFMKGGWINRNRILSANGPQAFTLQLIGASANKQINQIEVGANRNKLLRTIEQTYAKAPYITETKAYIESCFAYDDNNLGAFLGNSLMELAKLLDLPTQFKLSSELAYDRNSSAQNKVLTMCQMLGATRYINAEGGRELYNNEPFEAAGIELKFLQHIPTPYQQHRRAHDFEPRLSVIDALMNVGISGVRGLLNDFTLEAK